MKLIRLILSALAFVLLARSGHGSVSPAAVVFIEGFDFLTAAQATTRGWSQAWSSVGTGRFSGQAARLPGGATRKALPTGYTELYAGFAYRSIPAVAGDVFAFTTAGNVDAFRVRLVVTGSFFNLAILNSAGTVIATGTTNILASTWYYVEVHALINGASGSCSMRINGISEIANTTGNFGSTAVTQVTLTGGNNTDIDDVYVLDTTGSAPRNTFLGDVRVQTIMPSGAGSHTQWTPSTGSNFAAVDETTPNDDTDYVSDSTAGHYDTYAYADIDSGATVYAVQTNVWARKDDASVRQIAPVIRQSSTDYDGTTVTLGSSYGLFSQLYDKDPTAADWTAANVNADEFGIKLIA